MSSFSLCYILAAYFFIILIFGTENNRVHAAIIFWASLLNVMFILPESINLTEYIHNRNVSVLWDGATALILSMFLIFDKTAWKQALLLAFATLCHIMIIYDLTIASSIFSLFFYSFYDELIITIGILQMMVSYDGITAALGNIRKSMAGAVGDIRSYSQRLSSSEKGGKRT